MTLHTLTHAFAPLLIGVGGGLLAFVALSVAEFIGKLRDRIRRRRGLLLEQYRAEQAIRNIRREAIHAMLETARPHRNAYDDDVIEGTAVEVRR